MTEIAVLSLNKQRFLKKLHQKKYRYQYNTFFCEGYKTFNMAISQKNVTIKEIVITESVLLGKNGNKIKKLALSHGIKLYITDENVMKKLSDEKTPSNILFTVIMNNANLSLLSSCSDNNIVCLENISDPGNLGTIIRTCAWFGLNTIVLSSGCVDPYNPKTVRAGAGAIFYTKIFIDADVKNIINIFKSKNYLLTVTVPENGISIYKWKKSNKNLIFLGSEARGISKDVIDNSDIKLSIPGNGKIESLNVSVAAGIIFYNLMDNENRL